MSYTPTNWKAGDVVTSAKLNKMEQGIAASGGIRIVHLTMSGGLPSGGGSTPARSFIAPAMQLDITPNELMEAFENEEIVIVMDYQDSHGLQALISEFRYVDATFTVTINDSYPELTSSDPDEYFTYDPNSESSGDDDSGGTK